MKLLLRSDNKVVVYTALFIMLLCLVAVYHSVRISIADTQAYKAKYLLSKWEKTNDLPVKEEVETALNGVNSALYWEESNTEYMDLKAHILTYKGLLHWKDRQFSSFTDEAVELYQESTALRPKWPYAWARLALVKAYRGEVDALFSQAMARASKYGPWEPNVLQTMVEAGLFSWSDLDAATKAHLVNAIQRGLSYKSKGMKNVIQRYGLLNSVCGYLAINKKTRKLCGW